MAPPQGDVFCQTDLIWLKQGSLFVRYNHGVQQKMTDWSKVIIQLSSNSLTEQFLITEPNYFPN